MRRLPWGSLALGAVLGSAVTAAILLLPRVGEKAGNHEATEHPARIGPAATIDSPDAPEAEPSSATEPGSDDQARGQAGQGQVVHWLSGKLEEAYKVEALPEIIGSEAGQEAGRQTLNYMYQDYDTGLLEPELSSALADLEESHSLEDPWRLGPRGLDCQQPPCLLLLELEGDGPSDDCKNALRQLVSQIVAAAPNAVIKKEGAFGRSRCGGVLTVHTAQSAAREQELQQGIEGFLQVFGTGDRVSALKERASAD